MRRSRIERGSRDRIPHNAPETSDQKLDEALALTFPASDPPAQTQSIVHVWVKPPEPSNPRPYSR